VQTMAECSAWVARACRHQAVVPPPIDLSPVRWEIGAHTMQTSVPDMIRVEAGSVTITGRSSEQPIYAHGIRTTVARTLVGLPFALARLVEATSRRLRERAMAFSNRRNWFGGVRP
jgi:hypothetical protein